MGGDTRQHARGNRTSRPIIYGAERASEAVLLGETAVAAAHSHFGSNKQETMDFVIALAEAYAKAGRHDDALETCGRDTAESAGRHRDQNT